MFIPYKATITCKYEKPMLIWYLFNKYGWLGCDHQLLQSSPSTLSQLTMNSFTAHHQLMRMWPSTLAHVTINSCTCDHQLLHSAPSTLAHVTINSCTCDHQLLHSASSTLAYVTINSYIAHHQLLHSLQSPNQPQLLNKHQINMGFSHFHEFGIYQGCTYWHHVK